MAFVFFVVKKLSCLFVFFVVKKLSWLKLSVIDCKEKRIFFAKLAALHAMKKK